MNNEVTTNKYDLFLIGNTMHRYRIYDSANLEAAEKIYNHELEIQKEEKNSFKLLSKIKEFMILCIL